MTPDLVVDCRSKRCPLPVIELARRIEEVRVGGVVAVIADDPAAATDVPAWCRLCGHDYLGTEDSLGGAPSFLVRRR
jgi:tRNA 2-thiouridine synthesizing protein A